MKGDITVKRRKAGKGERKHSKKDGKRRESADAGFPGAYIGQSIEQVTPKDQEPEIRCLFSNNKGLLRISAIDQDS